MKFSEDITFVNRMLSGDEAAAAEFQREYFTYLSGALRARCGDARSRTKAEEISADVIADCFGANGSESLLSRYNGTSSLRGWLFLVGLNRLKSWWRSAHCRYEIAGEDSGERSVAMQPEETDPRREELIGDSEVVEILRRAFNAAVCFIDARDLKFLRAVFLYGFTQREVAEMWGCDVSTVSRHLDAAAKRLHEKVERYVEILDADLEITWKDCMAVCAVWPNLLQGSESSAIEAETLKREG